eukprot:m.193978 g.193978  ORF g.193978 m.193978 type:complete len:426 (+) comp15445_c0_seq3:3-1280(+)
MSSSFVRARPRGLPRGARPAAQVGQLIVSSGVPALDFILGGGLVVGTVTLIEEDLEGAYADVLVRYFLAEGAVENNALFVASAEQDPQRILADMPRVDEAASKTSSTSSTTAHTAAAAAASPSPSPAADTSMHIAWRYQNAPTVSAEAGAQRSRAAAGASHTGSSSNSGGGVFGHRFDLSTRWGDTSSLTATAVDLRPPLGAPPSPMHETLLPKLTEAISRFAVPQDPTAVPPDNILRVAITGLASPLWYPGPTGADCRHVIRVLHALRGLVRSAACACVVTVPTHLLSADNAAGIRRACDTAVAMHAFAASATKHPAFKDYHGVFQVSQSPRVNALTTAVAVEQADMVFRLTRTAFTIETLHLPPEEGDDVSRATSSSSAATTTITTSSGSSSSSSGATTVPVRVGSQGPLCQPNPTKKNLLDF